MKPNPEWLPMSWLMPAWLVLWAVAVIEGACDDDHVRTTDVCDGGCLVCDECDGDEGHDGSHDCRHGVAS